VIYPSKKYCKAHFQEITWSPKIFASWSARTCWWNVT